MSLLLSSGDPDSPFRVLPFDSEVVRWTFALCGVVLAIRAATMLSARQRPPGTVSLMQRAAKDAHRFVPVLGGVLIIRSEEHTSELQSLMRISYDVFVLKKT